MQNEMYVDKSLKKKMARRSYRNNKFKYIVYFLLFLTCVYAVSIVDDIYRVVNLSKFMLVMFILLVTAILFVLLRWSYWDKAVMGILDRVNERLLYSDGILRYRYKPKNGYVRKVDVYIDLSKDYYIKYNSETGKITIKGYIKQVYDEDDSNNPYIKCEFIIYDYFNDSLIHMLRKNDIEIH